MKKNKIRSMINHWDAVWYHYRTRTDLLPKDKIVTKFLLPGKTLSWNSLGFRYCTHITDLTVHEQLMDICPTFTTKFNNILVLNSFELRYKKIQDYAIALGSLSNYLDTNGRLMFGVNSIFIDWNRTAVDIEQTFEQLTAIMNDHYQLSLTYKILRPFEPDSLNGDCFLIFDRKI